MNLDTNVRYTVRHEVIKTKGCYIKIISRLYKIEYNVYIKKEELLISICKIHTATTINDISEIQIINKIKEDNKKELYNYMTHKLYNDLYKTNL